MVIVGWNDTTAAVTGVTDTKGNVYARAIGPTANPGVLSQSIYYAPNIVGATAGGNTVTVTFSPSAAYADIRILEYTGVVHASPLDVARGCLGEQRHQQQREPHHHRPGRPPGLREHGLHAHPRAGHRMDAPLRHLARRRHGRGPDRPPPPAPTRQRAARRRREPGCTRPWPSGPRRRTPRPPTWRSPRPRGGERPHRNGHRRP